MNGGAVDQRERRVVLAQDQSEIGPAEHDGLGAVLLDQLPAHMIEDRTLSLARNTGGRHRNIGSMHVIQILATWRYDFGAADAAIEARFHDGARSENSDPLEATFLHSAADLGNHVDNRQWRYFL